MQKDCKQVLDSYSNNEFTNEQMLIKLIDISNRAMFLWARKNLIQSANIIVCMVE